MRDPCRRHPIDLSRTLAATGLLLSALIGCNQQPAKPPSAVVEKAREAEPAPPGEASPAGRKQFIGSKNCRDCHAKFYELWST